jgi:hypothetical protein
MGVPFKDFKPGKLTDGTDCLQAKAGSLQNFQKDPMLFAGF